MDERLSKIHQLIETIRDAEAELEPLLGGNETSKRRAPTTCSKCGKEGHTARTCIETPTALPEAKL